MVPIRISLIEDCCYQGSYWTNGSSLLSWSNFKSCRSPPWLGWPLWNIYVTNDHGYDPLIASTPRSFPHSWLIIGFVTRLTRRMPLVEQELPTLPEDLSSPPVFSGVRVTRSLVLCVCFVDRCLSFSFWPLCCLFFFDVRILITPLVSSDSSYFGIVPIVWYCWFFVFFFQLFWVRFQGRSECTCC